MFDGLPKAKRPKVSFNRHTEKLFIKDPNRYNEIASVKLVARVKKACREKRSFDNKSFKVFVQDGIRYWDDVTDYMLFKNVLPNEKIWDILEILRKARGK